MKPNLQDDTESDDVVDVKLLPELDDGVQDDDVFNCELLGVDGCDANRAFAKSTGPSAIGCGSALGVLECE